MSHSSPLIVWFGELEDGAAHIAGGKGAGLNDMTRAGLPVPPGFTVCTQAFRQFIGKDRLREQILQKLHQTDVNDNQQLEAAARFIQNLITDHPLPNDIRQAIDAAYAQLNHKGQPLPVAVRSSAIAEDSAAASFAGQQDTYLNVTGAEAVARQVRACWASLFGARAIFYRRQKGSLGDVGMAVVVQRMLAPKKSGVLFTADPVQRRRDRMMIEATWGLGEAVVSGLVTPDHYTIDRNTGVVLKALVPPKPMALIRDEAHGGTVEIELDETQSQARVLDDIELQGLMRLGNALEHHFGNPQDVEWGIERGTIYLLQSRPITTL